MKQEQGARSVSDIGGGGQEQRGAGTKAMAGAVIEAEAEVNEESIMREILAVHLWALVFLPSSALVPQCENLPHVV